MTVGQVLGSSRGLQSCMCRSLGSRFGRSDDDSSTLEPTTFPRFGVAGRTGTRRECVAVGVYPRPVSSLRTLLETALARLAAIGADSRDDEETRDRKALLVIVSVLILPISLLWGGLYLALGAPSGLLAFVVLRHLARSDRGLRSDARLRPVPARRAPRHPARAEPVDDPARRLHHLHGRRHLGHPRPDGRARLRRRAIRHPLVRRVPRRLPRVAASPASSWAPSPRCHRGSRP